MHSEDVPLTPIEKKNAADGLGACRGVRAAIPMAIVCHALILLVGVFVLKLAGVL